MLFNNLTEDSPKIIQPENITIELMEHQKTAIYAMVTLENHGKISATNITHYNGTKNFNISTNVAILADKVGAGKSLTVISLIELQKNPPKRDIFWHGVKYISITEELSKEIISTNLLIIPHKLVQQWKNFFLSAPNLNIGTYIDFKDEEIIKSIDDVNNYNVMIIPCTKVDSFMNRFGKYCWSRIFIDEADSIKLSKNFEPNCIFMWLITATPKSLRYFNKGYLSNTFKGILPWVFNYIIVKNNNDFIDSSIILPPPKRIIINCLTPKELNIIKNIIPKSITTMINAGNIEDAIKLLNCNIDTTDNILKVVTNNIKNVIDSKKIELHTEMKRQVKHNSKAELEKQQKVKILNRCIDRLEERYNSIKKKIYSLNDQYCPICMDEFTKPTLVNCCQNVYCFECITLSLKNTDNCPFCRKKIYKNSFHIIDTNTKKIVEYNKKNKLNILLELLKNTDIDSKFLVFADYSQTFEKIKKSLIDNHISFEILKGTTDNIKQIIDDFSNNKIKVLMLNSKYFGAGMNLQMTTHIVFYHKFENRDIEEQAIGRAQRIGRTNQLTIFYLLHDNEINNSVNSDKFEDINYLDWLDNHS